MFDWNDLRFLLAVARKGSTLGAARDLGVNQTTVARRLQALEAELGVSLVERSQTGSRLTQAGAGLIEQAETMEKTAAALARRAAAHARGLAGTVRVTTVEAISELAVMPALPEFRRLFPDITVDMIVTEERLDVRDGAVDIALRAGAPGADKDLIVRRLFSSQWALYACRDYLARHGRPNTPSDLAQHQLIAAEGVLSRVKAMAWMLACAAEGQIVHRSNTIPNLVQAIKAGLGVGLLPRPVGALHEDLVECMTAPSECDDPLWIVIAPDSRSNPRVRAFIDFIAPNIVARVRALDAAADARLRSAADATIA